MLCLGPGSLQPFVGTPSTPVTLHGDLVHGSPISPEAPSSSLLQTASWVYIPVAKATEGHKALNYLGHMMSIQLLPSPNQQIRTLESMDFKDSSPSQTPAPKGGCYHGRWTSRGSRRPASGCRQLSYAWAWSHNLPRLLCGKIQQPA